MKLFICIRFSCTRFWSKIPKERDHSEDRGIDGSVGSERILGRLAGGEGDVVDSNGLGYGLVAGCCECIDESSGSSATELV
jgi:hypothetical protein